MNLYEPYHLEARHDTQNVPFQAVGLHIRKVIHVELSARTTNTRRKLVLENFSLRLFRREQLSDEKAKATD